MYRGTTPTLTMKLPFAVGLIKELSIAFSQNGELLLEKTKKDCILVGDTITLNLTQEDTLKLTPIKVEMQVRILDTSDQAFASKVYMLPVNKILRDGVLDAD